LARRGAPGGPQRLGEYRKTRLINIHRAALARRFEPDEAALAAYYAANRDSIRVPEARKLQMVVVESEQQARDIKAAIDKGDTTLYKAARDHSIDPGAKRNLGEIGWVLPGEGQPALDEALFALGPGEISEPVETPAGWHLLLATDVREEQYGNLAEPATRKRARRAYIHDKLDAYVVDLRKNHFPVEVDEANLTRLAQAEADMVKALSDKAAQPGSVTETRLQELQKIIKQP
jgi:parvulin-like peptidyl-prolyl isomerase